MSHQLDFPTQKVTPPLRRYSIGALTLPSSLSGSPFGPAKPFDPHRTICHIQIKGANADALAERERATSICATFSRAEIKNSVSNKMQMFDFVCGKAIGMAGHNFWPISKSKCVLMHGQTAATTIAFYVLFLCHTHTHNGQHGATSGSRMYCHLFTMPKLRLSSTLIVRLLCRCSSQHPVSTCQCAETSVSASVANKGSCCCSCNCRLQEANPSG